MLLYQCPVCGSVTVMGSQKINEAIDIELDNPGFGLHEVSDCTCLQEYYSEARVEHLMQEARMSNTFMVDNPALDDEDLPF